MTATKRKPGDGTLADSDTPMRTLTLRLAGRICIVEHVVTGAGGTPTTSYSALFLNTRHNPSLSIQKHKPLLCGPFERIKASVPRRGDSAFADPSGNESGLWSIKGFDLKFEDLEPTPSVAADISRLADLNAIYARVEPQAEWNTPYNLLRASDPRRFGIAARVSLDGFSQIKATAPPNGEPVQLVFHPGQTEQKVDVMVECKATFIGEQPGPAIIGASFDGCARPMFDIRGEHDIEISMSNLCHCAAMREQDPPTFSQILGRAGNDELDLDDEEFVVNYELLQNPPARERRPVPFRKSGAGGKVPECYRVSRLRLESEA